MSNTIKTSGMSDGEALRAIESRAAQLRGGYQARLGALHDAISEASPTGLLGGGFACGFLTDRLIAGGGDIDKALSAADMILAFTKGLRSTESS